MEDERKSSHRSLPTIGLDVGYDPGWPAGFNYIRNIVYTLSSLPEANRPRIRLFPLNHGTAGRLGDLARSDKVVIEAPRVAEPLRGVAYLARRAARKYLQPVLGRVLVPAFGRVDVTFPDWGRPLPGIPQIHWVPDFQHVHLPHFFSARELETRSRRVARIAATREVVVFSSLAAADDFRMLHPEAVATPEVWSFASAITQEARQASSDSLDLPDVFLYCANQFWAHKDHPTLFRALDLLAKKGIRPNLICTGLMNDARSPTYFEQITRTLKGSEASEQVRILGLVDRDDQIEILRRCVAVVQPSLFEGWGTVIEDAKAMGRPSIVSDLPVHREQVPDAIFFTPGCPSSLADAIESFLPSAEPGPDPEAEQRAAAITEERRKELGYRFLEICERALQIQREHPGAAPQR